MDDFKADMGMFFQYNAYHTKPKCDEQLKCEYYEDDNKNMEVCTKCGRLIRVCTYFIDLGIEECSHFYRVKD